MITKRIPVSYFLMKNCKGRRVHPTQAQRVQITLLARLHRALLHCWNEPSHGWWIGLHISLAETINQLFLSYLFLQRIALAFHAGAPPLLQSIATRVQHSLAPCPLQTIRFADQEHVLVFEGICRPPGHVRHSNFSSSSLKMPGGTSVAHQNYISQLHPTWSIWFMMCSTPTYT